MAGVTSGADIATLPEDMSEVRVTRSLVFCVMFCGSLFVLLSIFF
jgi:hypothetical protein